VIALLAALTLPCAGPAIASPPTVYGRANNQSPVHRDPDELLFIPGYGFSRQDTVVYRALPDTTQAASPPRSLPARSDGHEGIADVVSTADVPYALTVKLPSVMLPGQAYVLWVHTKDNEWSDAVKINDARPLWITPDYVYVSKALAHLPRTVKIVGRNLAAAPGAVTQVRLIGPRSYLLERRTDPTRRALEPFVAEVDLPPRLPAGTYTVRIEALPPRGDPIPDGWLILDVK